MLTRGLTKILRTNYLPSVYNSKLIFNNLKYYHKTIPLYQYPLKQAYIKGDISTPLQDLTIGQLFDRIVQTNPDNLAVISDYENIKWDYKTVSEKVQQLMRGLINLGLNKGDRIGVYMPNGSQWYLLQYASAKLGIILVTLNPAYRAAELKQALKQIQINVIVTIPKFKSTDYLDMLYQIIPELNNEDKIINSMQFPYLKNIIIVDDLIKQEVESPLKSPNSIIKFRDLLLTKDKHLDTTIENISKTLNSKEVINIQFTSGTTGLPKGVALTHHNLVNNGYYIGKNQNFTSQDIICIPVPLYHCFGLVLGNMACLNHASTVLYPHPSFDELKTLQSVQKYQATALYGVPTMFISMLNLPNFNQFKLSSLRTGIMAGSPCPKKIMKLVIEKMGIKEITICYGMTETSPVSFQSNTEEKDIDNRVETVGTIMPHVEAKILNVEDNKIVGTNEKGKLFIKGYLVMKGYWNNSIETNKILDKHGWLDTGDLATIDPNGYLRIVGRAKDMIIRGGENIYPMEIENILFLNPIIKNVSIIGVPDHKFGEQLCCCYILKEEFSNLKDDQVVIKLKETCSQLAHFKVPKYYWRLDQFPTTVSGKIQKNILREMAIKYFNF